MYSQEEYGPFKEDDVVRLAPTDEERETLIRQLIAKREQARLRKRKCKRSDRRTKDAAAVAASSHTSPGDTLNPDTPRCEKEDTHRREVDADRERKNGKKRKRKEKAGAAAAAAAAGGASAGPDSSKVADAAAAAVQKNKEGSKVYASLFGTKNVSNEHLFIATAGHRYNLG